MRILFLTTEVGGRGGIQLAGRLILRALCDHYGTTAELTVISVLDQPDQSIGNKATVRILGANGKRHKVVVQALKEWCYGPWDLILLGHVNLAPLVLVAHATSTAPVLALIYGWEAWQPIRGLRGMGMSRVDHVIYISDHSRRAAIAANSWLERLSASVCHLGLLPTTEELAAVSNPSALSDDASVKKPFALSIGRMASGERYKGQEELIDVWPDVNLQHPELELVFIGDGDDRPRLEALARERKAQVRFLGSVDDATRDAMLRDCRCFCLPSRGEGFGLVYLEAMQYGKPVLCGSQDAGCEIVIDRVTGRAVDAACRDELLEGVLDVCGRQAADMGASGRERFLAEFSFAAFSERFLKHVHAVMHGKRDDLQIHADSHSSLQN